MERRVPSPAREPHPRHRRRGPVARRGPGHALHPVHHAPPHLDRRNGPGWRARLAPLAALALFAVAIPWMYGLPQKLPLGARPSSVVARTPTPDDQDADGIDDAREDRLLAQFAPVALLAPDEPSLPASIDWLRARVPLGAGETLLGAAVPAWSFPNRVRRGSSDPADWVSYGHAFTAENGRTRLQYWMFFPYNEGPLFFDHEGDWEHVTVELDAHDQPVRMAFSRHECNAPGVWRDWQEIAREGERPLVVIARGTHATYATGEKGPFWEKLPDPRSARRWQTGSALVNVGERGHPRRGRGDAFLGYHGLWGGSALVGSSVPPGPPFQRSFCAEGDPSSCL